MTREEVEAKFRGNAGLVMPGERAQRVITAMSGIVAQKHLGDLMASLTP
jgi:hypothetical protein